MCVDRYHKRNEGKCHPVFCRPWMYLDASSRDRNSIVLHSYLEGLKEQKSTGIIRARTTSSAC